MSLARRQLSRARARQYEGMASTPPLWPSDVTSPPAAPPPVDSLWRPPPSPPAPASSPRVLRAGQPTWRDVVPAGALLVLSVGMHIAAMFPAYTGNPPVSVVSIGYETAIYICLALGWAATALLVLTRLSVRGGVALGAGIAAVELGFLVTDLAGAVQGAGRPTPGVWLAFAALGLGAAGVLLGASMVPMGGPRLRPYDLSLQPRAVVTVLVALLAVAAFLPSWDKYEVVNAAGRTTTVTLGNAFSQPAGIMAGELVAAFAITTVAILGAFWAPPAVGAWMTGGALIALSSQIISALVQVNQPLSVTIGGERATVALTWWWAIDAGAAVALAGLALWSALASWRASAQDRSRPLTLGLSPGTTPFEQLSQPQDAPRPG
jgi:hypothetical protein